MKRDLLVVLEMQTWWRIGRLLLFSLLFLLFLSLFYDLPLCVCLVVHLFLFLSFSVPSLSSVSGAGDGEDNGHSFLLFLFSLFVLFICSLCVVPQYYLRSSPAFLVRSLSPPVSPQFVLSFPSFFFFPVPLCCVLSPFARLLSSGFPVCVLWLFFVSSSFVMARECHAVPSR